MKETLGIDKLADAAGLTRRAIRFYVQQKLLPAPLGVGRGKHYDGTHLERLKHLRELQAAGYSLDAIRQILEGAKVEAPPKRVRSRGHRRPLELWTRVPVANGVELYINVDRYHPDLRKLLKARKAIRAALGLQRSASTREQGLAADRTRKHNGSGPSSD